MIDIFSILFHSNNRIKKSKTILREYQTWNQFLIYGIWQAYSIRQRWIWTLFWKRKSLLWELEITIMLNFKHLKNLKFNETGEMEKMSWNILLHSFLNKYLQLLLIIPYDFNVVIVEADNSDESFTVKTVERIPIRFASTFSYLEGIGRENEFFLYWRRFFIYFVEELDITVTNLATFLKKNY